MIIRLAVMLAWASILAGCAGRGGGPAQIAPDTRPVDFVLAATVHEPEGAGGGSRPGSLRAARYIVEADGSLRAAVGRGARDEAFPALTRQLTPAERDELWRLVVEADLLDQDSDVRVRDPSRLPSAFDVTTAVVWVSFGDTTRTARMSLERRSEQELAAERVIGRLASWAWVR